MILRIWDEIIQWSKYGLRSISLSRPAITESTEPGERLAKGCNVHCHYDTRQMYEVMRMSTFTIRNKRERDSCDHILRAGEILSEEGGTRCSQLPVYTISLMFQPVTSDMISCLLSASEDGTSANQRPVRAGQSEGSWGEGCVVTQSVSLCYSINSTTSEWEECQVLFLVILIYSTCST